MLIDGLEWIIVMFYQLFGLILTAPIHCRGSIGEQVKFSKSVAMNVCLQQLLG